MKCAIGDRVRVAKRLYSGLVDIDENRMVFGTVIDIIQENNYQPAMYLIRFDSNIDESWVDCGRIYDSVR